MRQPPLGRIGDDRLGDRRDDADDVTPGGLAPDERRDAAGHRGEEDAATDRGAVSVGTGCSVIGRRVHLHVRHAGEQLAAQLAGMALRVDPDPVVAGLLLDHRESGLRRPSRSPSRGTCGRAWRPSSRSCRGSSRRAVHRVELERPAELMLLRVRGEVDDAVLAHARRGGRRARGASSRLSRAAPRRARPRRRPRQQVLFKRISTPFDARILAVRRIAPRALPRDERSLTGSLNRYSGVT